MNAFRRAAWRVGRGSSRFWMMPCVVSGVPRRADGLATLADHDSSLNYVTPVANAAICLTQAQAPPKP